MEKRLKKRLSSLDKKLTNNRPWFSMFLGILQINHLEKLRPRIQKLIIKSIFEKLFFDFDFAPLV